MRVSGPNDGDTRIDVAAAGMTHAPGPIDDCPAVLEVDPATLVLTVYGRMNGGTVRGDRGVADRFLSLFLPI